MASYNPVEKVVTCHLDIPVVANNCIFRNRLGKSTQYRAVEHIDRQLLMATLEEDCIGHLTFIKNNTFNNEVCIYKAHRRSMNNSHMHVYFCHSAFVLDFVLSMLIMFLHCPPNLVFYL